MPAHDADFDPARAIANARQLKPAQGSLHTPIDPSATFDVERATDLPKLFTHELNPDEHGRYLYGRPLNPTVHALATKLAAMEATEAAACAASGISVIAACAMHHCKPGERILASQALYGGTFSLFSRFLPNHAGLTVDFVDMGDLGAVRAAITDSTRMLYVETMSNPTLRVADIPALATIARGAGAPLVVDNTFSPITVAPALHGADVVIHSLTKFINGATDLLGGVLCGPKALIDEMQDLHDGALMLLGSAMDARVAHEIAARLPHLPLRIEEHCKRALLYAQRLHERGMRVVYPGLANHPSYETLSRIHNERYGFGGMLGLDMGDRERADRLLDLLRAKGFGRIAVSLGFHDTLMCVAGATTASGMDAASRERVGVSPGYIRFAIGISGAVEDRWAAMEQSLDALDAHH